MLVLAFLLLGTVVYQVTAPTPLPGQGFRWSRFWRGVRGELVGRNARLEVQRTAEVDVSSEITILRLAGFRGQVTFIGEDRQSVAAELVADVYGTDQADARTEAEALRLDLEKDGAELAVKVEGTSEAPRRRPRLVVRMPHRVGLNLQSVGDIEAASVNGVTLDTRGGTITLRDIRGAVAGQHRDGDITVSQSGEVSMNARRGHVRLEQLSGGVAGEFVDGRLTARDIAGPITLETRRVDIELEETAADVVVAATDGSLGARHPKGAVKFEGRRARLTLMAAAAIALDVNATDAPVDLLLPGTLGITADFAADEGRLDLPPDVDLEPVRSGNTLQARGAVGGGGPTWRVRTTRGDIVVRR